MLLDHELVECLLALAIPRRDTKGQAKALIARLRIGSRKVSSRTTPLPPLCALAARLATDRKGVEFGGIGPLLAADVDTLRREGLSDGVVAALKIAQADALCLLESKIEGRPILSSWDAVGDYLTAAMAHSAVEEVRVLFLNSKNLLLANEAMSRGSVDEACTRPRSLRPRHRARRHRADHRPQPPKRRPGAKPAEHPPDKDLVEAGRHMRVTVHDHVIVGASGRSSMKAARPFLTP